MKKLRNFVGMLLLAVLCTGCNMESEEAINGKIAEIESYGKTFSSLETFTEKLYVMKELENLLPAIENKTFEEKFSDESYALFKNSSSLIFSIISRVRFGVRETLKNSISVYISPLAMAFFV